MRNKHERHPRRDGSALVECELNAAGAETRGIRLVNTPAMAPIRRPTTRTRLAPLWNRVRRHRIPERRSTLQLTGIASKRRSYRRYDAAITGGAGGAPSRPRARELETLIRRGAALRGCEVTATASRRPARRTDSARTQSRQRRQRVASAERQQERHIADRMCSPVGEVDSSSHARSRHREKPC